MKLNIQPIDITLKPEVKQTFTSISYVVTYDNAADNSAIGIGPGQCVVTFKGQGATPNVQPGLAPITILGTAGWTDEQVDAEIIRRLGVTRAT
jgi:hypothetical protein